MTQVFNDAAARLVLEVLAMEQLAVASIQLNAHPNVTILIPESALYREYIQPRLKLR